MKYCNKRKSGQRAVCHSFIERGDVVDINLLFILLILFMVRKIVKDIDAKK